MSNLRVKEENISFMLDVIPLGWELFLLDELGMFSKGKGISKKDLTTSGQHCIRYAEIYTKYDDYVYELESFIGNDAIAESREMRYGDILFTGSGEKLEDIGKCVAYLGDEVAYVGGDVIILSEHKQDPMFLGFQLNSVWSRRQKYKLGQGHSVVHIYSSGLKTLKLPLPPIKEQQKIAKILTTWDHAIDTMQKLIQQKQNLKKGLMQVLLTGNLRFDGFVEEWEEVRLGEVCLINPKNDMIPDRFIYIDLESVVDGILVKSNFIDREGAPSRAQRNLVVGDILYQMVRPYQRNNLFFNKQGDYVASTGYAQLRYAKSSLFLYFLLHSNYFVNRVITKCTGTSYPAINSRDLSSVKIVIPLEIEQQKIAKTLSASDQEIKILNQQLSVLQEQKRGLMQRLLTGEVRVKI